MNNQTKICTKCGQELPATPEFFNRSTRCKDGLYNSCRKCREEYRHANAGKIKEQKAAEYQRNKEKYMAYARSDIAKERVMDYYYQHREDLIQKALIRQWKDHEGTLQKRREQYHDRREKDSERRKQWRLNNPEKNMEQYHRRRRLEVGCEGSHTAEDIKLILENQGYRCFWCNCDIKDSCHIDHVIPLSRNGTDYPSNLVGSCPSCNTSKRDRLPYTEWIPPRLRQQR